MQNASSIKICFVSFAPQVHELFQDSSSRTGGAAIQQVLVGHALKELGMKVEYVVPAVGPKPSEFESDGMKVRAGLMPSSGLRFVRALTPLLSTIRSLKEAHADVYHVWGPVRGTGYLALYCLWKRIPFIFNVYNNRDVDGTTERRLSRIDRFLFRLVMRRAPLIFAETNLELELVRRNFGREGVLVRNMCAPKANADAATKRDIILWVGGFRAEKRPDMFVELAARLPDRQFVMVGGEYAGEEDLYRRIADQALTMPNLALTSKIPLDKVTEYYKRALVFVLTSTSEGFPNVILEAWREGTPVVSTFDPDGVMTKYKLGYYAEDLDGLEAGVRRLIDDRSTRITMGKRAIEYVREHHDPESLAQQVMEAMCHLVRRPMEGQA